MGNSRIPMLASAASVAFNVTLNLLLVRMLGHRGLALGTAAAALLNAALLITLLRTRLDGVEGRRLLTATTKICLASIAMAVAAFYSERALHAPFAGEALMMQAVRVFGAIGIAIGVLAVSAHVLRIEEFTQLRHRMLRF
jgi:putative peptidoglycan lipid II flippase